MWQNGYFSENYSRTLLLQSRKKLSMRSTSRQEMDSLKFKAASTRDKEGLADARQLMGILKMVISARGGGAEINLGTEQSWWPCPQIWI